MDVDHEPMKVRAALGLGHSPPKYLKAAAHATLTDRREVDYLDPIPAESADSG